MEVIILTSRWVVGWVLTKSGLRLPPISAYKDDLNTLKTTKACTRWCLDKLQDHLDENKSQQTQEWSDVKRNPAEHRFYLTEVKQWQRGRSRTLDQGSMQPLKTQYSWTKLGRIPKVAEMSLMRPMYLADLSFSASIYQVSDVPTDNIPHPALQGWKVGATHHLLCQEVAWCISSLPLWHLYAGCRDKTVSGPLR